MDAIRIVIADDHRLFRDGLCRLIDMEPDILVVGEARDGVEAIEKVKEHSPDILLIDVNMPRMDGIQAIQSLRRSHNIRIIALTAFDDDEHVQALGSAGIHGYVLKSSGIMELLTAVRMVARGETFVDQRIAGRMLGPIISDDENQFDMIGDLTPKETEVLYWLSQGMKNNEIAAKMVLSEKTVKNHVSHILKKLDLQDRTQAAVMAWRIGLVHEYSYFSRSMDTPSC